MTLTETYMTQIKKMKVGSERTIPASDCTMSALRAYYRAARMLGVKVSIKTSPDGMRLWRLT